jgi:predicted anti-sigma-YlaC factor YlaD
MNGHLSEQLIDGYRRRALPPMDLLEADDHLAECENCRRRLDKEPCAQEFTRSLRLELESTGPAHLAYERLEAYVDGALDPVDREIVEGHLMSCAGCSSELEDLRAFAAELVAAPIIVPQTVAATPIETARIPSKSWREWLDDFIRLPAVWLPVRLAAFGLMIGLLTWTAWLQSKNSALQTALDEQKRENQKLSQDYQAASGSVAELEKRIAQLEGASSFLATLEDGGGRITLDARGNLTGVAPAYMDLVKQTLTSGRVETPSMLAGLAGKSAILMGPSGDGRPFALLGPVGVVVLSDRPVFRWGAFKGAESYVVRIYDSDFNQAAASPQVAETSWTASVPLRRGRVYSWQATALVDGREVASPVKPAPDARFMVLDQATAGALAKAKNDAPRAHLILGVLYAQAGLLEDAEREFQALLLANPQSGAARKLLQDVKSLRR